MFPTGGRGSRVGEEKGEGAGVSPRDTMPREKRKMPAVSSRPVGVVVWVSQKSQALCGGLARGGYSSSQSGQVLSAVVGSSVRVQPQWW